MSTKVYVVCKQGVYRHEILGIFQGALAAVECGVKALAAETDNWHRFEIGRAFVGQPIGDIETLLWLCKRDDGTHYALDAKNVRHELTAVEGLL